MASGEQKSNGIHPLCWQTTSSSTLQSVYPLLYWFPGLLAADGWEGGTLMRKSGSAVLVIPDLAQPDTSVDGGVAWLNMPVNNSYSVSAIKEGVHYPTVTFSVTEADVEAGVQLYIASPPDSLEGDNDSAPGEF
jgi:hypothetical protein